MEPRPPPPTCIGNAAGPFDFDVQWRAEEALPQEHGLGHTLGWPINVQQGRSWANSNDWTLLLQLWSEDVMWDGGALYFACRTEDFDNANFGRIHACIET